jgi:feruloyl esterase
MPPCNRVIQVGLNSSKANQSKTGNEIYIVKLYSSINTNYDKDNNVCSIDAVYRKQSLSQTVKCTDLLTTSFGAEVKIESTNVVAATVTTPEHCDVRDTIWPEAKFALKLPKNWNQRFIMVGNGGTAGTISLAAMEPGLRRGFAVVSTDTGHDAAKEPGASFAYPGPNNPNAKRKLIDFAYQAVHETAVLAKQIIRAHYGAAPRYSYWQGCSTGGRQGLMEAQRYPEDFDGLVVGAPVLNHTFQNMRHIWNARAVSGPGAIASNKLPTLANAVYKKCDGIDGLEDGLIDDPRRCKFDPAIDLPGCPANEDNPNCFTPAQIESLRKIYGGVRNSVKLLFSGQPVGAEVLAQNRSGWDALISGASLNLPLTYMRYAFFDPPPGPTWDYKLFNFDTDPQRMAGYAAIGNATNPDLRKLKQRGGRIIHYHGWADTGPTAFMSADYYESVLAKMGEKATKEFYRLFLIPGMFHCRGGVGCDTVDWLTAIVDWVEKGKAPGSLLGAHVEGSVTRRTRPLCSYPQVARYKGTGSIDAAENFICVKPDNAEKK